MREIKFNAYDTKTKRMYTGGQIESDSFITFSGKVVEPIIHYPDGLEMREEKDIIKLQYTGLKDKNGDEIYDGHILKYENPKYPNHKPYVIRWSDEECGFECVNESNFMLPSVWSEMEIIGNIFENPDLVDQNVIMDIYSFDKKEVK